MALVSLQVLDHVGTLCLNKPALHNAFDAELIAELTEKIDLLGRSADVRCIVLTGAGTSFSAGADLHWMRAQQQASQAENLADAKRLAQLMRTLAYCSKPTIARVNGQAFGGGVGLIACCDIAIGVSTARFALTESKLGLAPAVISPYVINAIGARQAMRYFQSAELFGAERARELGLLHAVAESDALDAAISAQIKLLKTAGPQAMKSSKQLVQQISGRSAEAQMLQDEQTAQLIATLRVSEEGQEGLRAFLEKRTANFVLP
jgi:methylglutaconyl-CoA hydratase